MTPVKSRLADGRLFDRLRRAVLGSRTIGVALAIAAVGASIPEAALAGPADPSPTAGKISAFYDPIFWAVVAVFVVAGSLIVFAAVRPRPPAADEPSPALERLTSRQSEIAWTVAPAVFLALIAVLAYRAFH